MTKSKRIPPCLPLAPWNAMLEVRLPGRFCGSAATRDPHDELPVEIVAGNGDRYVLTAYAAKLAEFELIDPESRATWVPCRVVASHDAHREQRDGWGRFLVEFDWPVEGKRQLWVSGERLIRPTAAVPSNVKYVQGFDCPRGDKDEADEEPSWAADLAVVVAIVFVVSAVTVACYHWNDVVVNCLKGLW